MSAQDALCAEVKIVIQQRLSLERQAFDAALTINNGLEGIAVENIDVNVVFTDESGQAVIGSSDPGNTGATFFIDLDHLEGLSGVNGDGVVEPQSSGSATWLIIPSATAGGQSALGARYSVGATISYRLGDEDKTVEVVPEIITVRPQPRLYLDYFLPFDVYADDPFTPDIVEPSEPFTLGVRIKNVGYGDARNLTIETAQPEIVDNDQGLLVNFEILGGYVDDQLASPSLLLDFGDITPQDAKIGRWQMITSLSGQFRDMNTTYTHADTLGGALTSLIANPDGVIPSHRLVKDVLVDLPGRDQVHDFLAYREGGDFLHVFESEGNDCEYEPSASCVTELSGSIDHLGGGNYSFVFAGSPPANQFVYAKIASPFGEQRPALTVHRADGSPLPTSNAWMSKERDSAGTSWLYYFNLFDIGGQAQYTFVPEDIVPLAEISGLVYVDNGQPDPPLTLAGVHVLLQGISDSDVAVDRLTVTTVDGRFRFGDLETGVYDLTVADVDEYVNGTHTAGSAGGTSSGVSILGIDLDPGEIATGYAFAKQPVATVIESDLALTLLAPTEPVMVDTPFELRLALANLGPAAAQQARVDLTLPAAFVIDQDQASSGSFDPDTNAWSLDSLASASSAELVLTVRATEEGSYPVTTSADHVAPSPVVDPHMANNQAAVMVEVELPSELELTAGVAREARVLVFIDCVAFGGGGGATICGDQQAEVEALLADLSIADYWVTTAHPAFLSELRSGYWNVIWLSSSADHSGMTTAIIDELDAHLLSGDGLIVEGDLDSISTTMSSLLGIWSAFEDDAAGFPILVNEDLLPPGQYSVTGTIFPFLAVDSTLLAGFPNRNAASAEREVGEGAAITLGFNPTDVDDPVARLTLAQALFDRVTPAPTTEVATGGYVPISAGASNGDSTEVYQLFMSAPVSNTFVDARPDPTILQPQSIEWNEKFLAGEVLNHIGLLLTSSQPGSAAIDITLLETPLGDQRSETVSLTILSYGEYLIRAQAAVANLLLADPEDIAAQNAALADIDTALDYATDGLYHLARSATVDALGNVRAIAGASTTAIAVDLGHAAKLFARLWFETNATCDRTATKGQNTNAAPVLPESRLVSSATGPSAIPDRRSTTSCAEEQ